MNAAPTSKQQAATTLHQAKRVLLVLPAREHDSAFAGASALAEVLVALGKEVVVLADTAPGRRVLFLSGKKWLTHDLDKASELVVSIDISKKLAKDIHYQVTGERLQIFVTPEESAFTPEDVQISATEPKFDVIVALGGAQFADFGKIAARYTKLFAATPTVMIGTQTPAKPFGTITVVDEHAASIQEILLSLIEALDRASLNASVSTALYTGLVIDTAAFRSAHTTAKTMTVAAQLLGAGADKITVMASVFPPVVAATAPTTQHDLPTLKLWGRVLARLRQDKNQRLLWSLVEHDDFSLSGATSDALESIGDELLATVPDTWTSIVLARIEPAVIRGYITNVKNRSAVELAKIFDGKGDARHAIFEIPSSDLASVEELMLERIKTAGASGVTTAGELRERLRATTPNTEPATNK